MAPRPIPATLLAVALMLGRTDTLEAADRAVSITSAKALYQQRNFRAAIEVLHQMLRSNPGDPEAEQILALAYYSNGDVQDAVPLLEHLRSTPGPIGFDTGYLLGMCYLKLAQLDQARAAFAQMYSVPADGGAAHLFFARMLVREHREDEAAGELSKGIALNPRLGMAHFLLGEIQLHKGATEAAISEFRKELEISPGLWLVYWRLADALVRSDSLEEAERSAKQAIWLNESFSGSYVTLGEIALKRGDLELAEGLLQRATKMEPGNQNAHYSLAKVYQRLGKKDEASHEFELCRSLLTTHDSSPSFASIP